MVIGTYISKHYLKFKRIKFPNQNTQTGWIQKQELSICYLQEVHFRPRDMCRLKVRGWKKIFHANGNQKKAGETILISDKIDFKDCYKRQGRTLPNDQGVNPIRKYKKLQIFMYPT